jgi:3-deoxy-D-manno-octulosonate 8-phosphate phosphatase (KDO 8-P phosphatase)
MVNDCLPTEPGAYPSDCEILEGYRARVRERGIAAANDPKYQLALAKARDIKLLLLDVDGVLTDGSLLYSSTGEESKAFNTQDGFGLRLLHQAGIETGIITARESAVVGRRAEELGMRYIYQGAKKKTEAYRAILHQSGRKPFEVAYMGDDWLDLVLQQQVGLALAPANCVPEVREMAHYITPRSGGMGAVRDACDLILTARGKLAEFLQGFLQR